ncbi:hypothetical protein COOONC_09466 [Cooperia oncophora]
MAYLVHCNAARNELCYKTRYGNIFGETVSVDDAIFSCDIVKEFFRRLQNASVPVGVRSMFAKAILSFYKFLQENIGTAHRQRTQEIYVERYQKSCVYGYVKLRALAKEESKKNDTIKARVAEVKRMVKPLASEESFDYAVGDYRDLAGLSESDADQPSTSTGLRASKRRRLSETGDDASGTRAARGQEQERRRKRRSPRPGSSRTPPAEEQERGTKRQEARGARQESKERIDQGVES